MTLGIEALGLYALALFVVFLTPGPVWVAMLARALAGGWHGAWPLALGVALGDMAWPLIAMGGLGWIVASAPGLLDLLRFGAAVIFVGMGVMLLRTRKVDLHSDSTLTRAGFRAGFLAGILAILGNPKAILFYFGILPGFFELDRMSGWDIAVIALLSGLVPLAGNLILAGLAEQIRPMLRRPGAALRVQHGAGLALILVGLGLPFLA